MTKDWLTDEEIQSLARSGFMGPQRELFLRYVRQNSEVQGFWFGVALFEAGVILVAVIAAIMAKLVH